MQRQCNGNVTALGSQSRAGQPRRSGQSPLPLPLHCRYTAVTSPLHWCVTSPLHCRYTAVTLPLHYERRTCGRAGRYITVTLPLHCRYITVTYKDGTAWFGSTALQHLRRGALQHLRRSSGRGLFAMWRLRRALWAALWASVKGQGAVPWPSGSGSPAA